MSHDNSITISADILQITDAAVLIDCEGEETWLPLSQVDFCGERGDTDVPITLPEWLGNDKGLSHGDGMCAAVTSVRAVQEGNKAGASSQPQTSVSEPDNALNEPEHCCETCLQWGGKEVGPDAGECLECSVSKAAENPTGDYWRPDNASRRCETCAHYGVDYPDDCEPCQEDATAPNWRPSHSAFAPIPNDPPDTSRVTLTILFFPEDGEAVLVEDSHGNQWSLSTPDFVHDADELNVGDTLLCYVKNAALAAEGCTLQPDCGSTQSESEVSNDAEDTPSAPKSGTAFIKTDTITVSVPIDGAEREAVGDRMATALGKISELEDALDAYRKRVNAEIKSLQKDAEKARKEWQEGKTEEEVYCDMMADYDACAIVWVDHDSGKAMRRRPMTAEERQYRLPIPRPGDAISAVTPSTSEQPTPVAMGTPRTCITCGSLAGRDGDDLPETCQVCSQASNGNNDNWHPIRECRTCTNSHTKVNMPPCSGCALNVEEAQRGESDAWEWKDDGAANAEPDEQAAGETKSLAGEKEEDSAEADQSSSDTESTKTAAEELPTHEGAPDTSSTTEEN